MCIRDSSGTRLEGTVVQVVYLGMYTQFHVETAVGRLVSHRLADELVDPLEPTTRVSLTWEPEHTSVVSGSGLQAMSL